MARDWQTDLRAEADEIAERTTKKLSFVVKDEADVALADTDLTTLTMTLYDKRTGTIINSQDDTDILNVGPGTVDGSGNGVITLAPADNQILSDANALEDHVCLVEWTYAAGAKSGRHEILLRVINLLKVT